MASAKAKTKHSSGQPQSQSQSNTQPRSLSRSERDEDEASFSSDISSDLDDAAHSGVESDDLSDLWEDDNWREEDKKKTITGNSKLALIRPLALVTAKSQSHKSPVPPLDFSSLLGEPKRASQSQAQPPQPQPPAQKPPKPNIPSLPLAQLNQSNQSKSHSKPSSVVPLAKQAAGNQTAAKSNTASKVPGLSYKPLAPITISEVVAGKQLQKAKAESGVLDSPSSSSDAEDAAEPPVAHQFDSEEEDEQFYAEVAQTAADIAAARQQGLAVAPTVSALGGKLGIAKDSKFIVPNAEKTIASVHDLSEDEDSPHSFGSHRTSVTASTTDQHAAATADAKTPKRPIQSPKALQDDDRLCSRTCASGTRRCVIM